MAQANSTVTPAKQFAANWACCRFVSSLCPLLAAEQFPLTHRIGTRGRLQDLPFLLVKHSRGIPKTSNRWKPHLRVMLPWVWEKH